MPEQLAPPPPDFELGPDLPGGPMNIDSMFPASTFERGEDGLLATGISFVDRDSGEPRSIDLRDGEKHIQGPYGPNGEPRKHFVVKVDEDGNEIDRLPFADYVDLRDAEASGDSSSQEAEAGKETEPTNETSAASDVFYGVARRLGTKARERTSKNTLVQNPATGEYETVAMEVDPAREFVGGYLERMQRNEANIGDRDRHDVASEIVQNLQSQGLETATVERGQAVINEAMQRTDDLVAEGAVDERTAQYFWGNLNIMKQGLSAEYGSVVNKEGQLPPVDQDAYRRSVSETLSQFGERAQPQAESGFVEVNRDLRQEADATERLYISPKPDGNPAEVVKIWTDTLNDLDLQDDVYFKTSTAVTNRYDGIVMFRLDNMEDETFNGLVEEFAKRCPAELLDPEPMPTGAEVVPGLSTTPEPTGVNQLLRYATRTGPENFDQLSYNKFATGMSEMAFRVAAADLRDQGVDMATVTPKQPSRNLPSLCY